MASTSTEERLREALDENIRLKEELEDIVYAVSHDVKSALRSVSSYSQLLIRQSPAGEQTSQYGKFIADGIGSAVAIVDRLNTFTRIYRSPPRTNIALKVIVQMTLLKLQQQIRDSSAEISCRELPEVSVNESQFVLLFENLIENALRYRGTAPPRVEISAEETDDGYLISVADNGPGIEPRYHEFVFRPFKRLHGKDIPGTGLGLAMCSKIAAAHGGRIWVESDGRNGSTFKIAVPF
ncbi:MAG: hypothetical protein JOZ62_22165 [Acidobacteriaceae bacterium]|nr:hypothetical protein [Acidobacteriaceae bacterium]